MLRLTQAPNIAIATLWVDMLCQAGMPATLQRYYLGSVAGDLPPDQCLPEVWLTHDEQEPQARACCASCSTGSAAGSAVCACGETAEGGALDHCWACGRPMP
jgi:hypothetical protein